MEILYRIASVFSTLLICLVFFCFGQIPLIEGYNPVKPDIDTQFAEKYDEAKFFSIKPGTDTNAVVLLIGRPMSRQNLGDTASIWYYSNDGKCEWDDFAWLGRNLWIDRNGKVSLVATPVCYD